MDFIIEVLFWFIFEVLGEVLFEAGSHGAAAVLRSFVGHFVVASVAGLGAGLWWGARLSERGRVREPRTVWMNQSRSRRSGCGSGGLAMEASVVSPPWCWPTYRLVGFAILNAAVAAGVAIGFHPHPLR